MKDLLKEIGKYFFDISKIVLAVAVLTPLVKDGSYNIYAIGGASMLFILGSYITYKGIQND